jgi:GNAT superfamily N-acetyltransferase
MTVDTAPEDGHAWCILFHTERQIDARQVRVLYDQVDWWPNRQPEAIAQVLSQDITIGAWAGDELVAFARAISDGQFHAYIEDVVVHPDYCRCGIARRMLTRLIEALRHIETISLFCAPDLVALYEQVGFRAHPRQVVMHRPGGV